MRRLSVMLLKHFVPIFFFSLLFFVFILEMVDFLANFVRYVSLDAPLGSIMEVSLYYLPKCVQFAIPISLLFSVTFTMGQLYANNELVAVFAGGIPLVAFVRPLIILGVAFSVLYFFFEDNVVVDTYAKKMEKQNLILRRTTQFNQNNVLQLNEDNRVFYYVNQYNDNEKMLSGVLIVIRDEKMRMKMRLEADSAVWAEERWVLKNVRAFEFDLDGKTIERKQMDSYSDQLVNLPPMFFRKESKDIESMRLKEAIAWIKRKGSSDTNYKKYLTDYYKRFSFSLTPFIVIFFSCAVGGRFRKNILPLSLAVSLGITVLYYGSLFALTILGRRGVIEPAIAAWIPVILFALATVLMYRKART